MKATGGVNSVEVSWSAAHQGADLLGFFVHVTGPGADRWVRAASEGRSVNVLGLRNGVEYSFQVFAVGEGGSSVGSAVVQATPTTGVEGVVAGLIVEFSPTIQVAEGSQSVPGSDRVEQVDLTVAQNVSDDAVLIALSEPVDLATAEQIASDLSQDELVQWAEPDQFFFTSNADSQLAQTVSVPADSDYATSQWNLWDSYGISIGDGSDSMTQAWAGSKGDGVTVAVIDTGITAHPDLDAQLVSGYDFVSNPDKLASSRQPNAPPVPFDADYQDTNTFGVLGRDDNPTDPGDWSEVAPVRNSSWHGTKIAGLIAAAANDDGITGIAPNAKIQPIRALSWRGGLLSDIAASITWASGGEIDGVPTNQNPSKVINMSFAVETICPTALQDAINGARERGSILIAAAGNANDDAAKFAPGNCNGVIAVGASNRDGNRADYSNYGEKIDISAPGGDAANPITSTSNTGTQTPDQPTTTGDFGTSIAAAHVSAAAAILASRNAELSPDQAYEQLTGKDFTKAFANEICDITNSDYTCGTGILTLAQISSAPTCTQSTTNYSVGSVTYRVVRFTGTASSTTTPNFAECTWSRPSGIESARVLVVAGGGAGGGSIGGGGGGGGVRDATVNSLTAASYTIRVGGRGLAYDYRKGDSGGDSSALNLTASGGGGGGAFANASGPGQNGGSGGGGSCDTASFTAGGTGNTPATSPSQGSNGGAGNAGGGPNCVAGGGGGAGQAGSQANATTNQSGGKGGDGRESDITGVAVRYGAGGGGGVNGVPYSLYPNDQSSGNPGAGGLGGGGAGGTKQSVGPDDAAARSGISAEADTGSGGGGASNGTWGGNGGNGLVIISYAISPPPGNSSIEIVNSTNNQTATAGSAISNAPQVLVKGSDGLPLVGASVTFAVASGGGSLSGSVSSATVTTNTSGVATSPAWTLGTAAGENTLTAEGPKGSVTFTATGTPGAATAAQSGVVASPLSVVANGSSTSTITVTARDANNNLVSDQSIFFQVASGTGSLSSGPWTTSASGVATATVTSTTAGTVTVRGYLGTSASGTLITQTASVTFTPGPASKIVVTGPSSVVAGVTSSDFTVTSYDQFDNVAPVTATSMFTLATSQQSATATFTPVSGSLQITAGASSATFTYRNTKVGSGAQTLTVARSSGDAVGSATAGITVTPAAASGTQSTLVASATQVTANGSTVTLTVQARDQYGNAITADGAIVVITESSGSATLSGVTDNGNGTYSATVTAPTTVGSSVFVATIDGVAVQGGTGSQQQATVTYVAGSATKLVITGSGLQDAGQSQTITITAQDANGNTATTYSGSKTLRFSGAGSSANPVTAPTVGGVVFGSDSTVNFSSGQATASMVLFKAEAASISVTDPAASLISSGAGNLAVTVTANDPNKLVVSAQPVAATSGALFSTQPVVRILDAYGNLTNSTATVTVSAAGVGGVLGGSEATGKAASGGVATFTNLTFSGRVGTAYKLEFDSGALTGVDSNDFSPTGAGVAQTIAVNAGDGETATAGAAVLTSPSVLVTDSAGNPVSGITVTFAAASGGGSITGANATTNASGVASSGTWTLGTTAGANTVTATSGSLLGSPVTFTATGTPGSADSLRNSQSLAGAASGAAFTTQPWISIVDANSNVVISDNGRVVTASVSAGGTLVGTTTASTVNGVAKFTNLGLTGTNGTQYTITFSATGVNSVDQSVTVSIGPAAKLVVTTAASGATYGNVWVTQPVVEIQDSGGNLVTTDSTTDVTVAITGQTITGTTTVRAESGVATFSGLLLTAAPSTFTLVFSSSPVLTGASSSLVLTQAPQSISFGGLSAKTFGDAPFTVSATASSNLTVGFASQTGTICSVSGTTVTILAAGTCTIRASQAGDANFLAASDVDQSFTVNQATPTFTWSNTVVTYGTDPYPITAPMSSTPGTFTYSSSNTSVIAIAGSQVTVVGAGTSVVTATFTPTDTGNYVSGGTVTSSITVNTVQLTVTASSPTVTYGDAIPTITASLTGFVNGETATVLTSQPTCATAYTQTSNAGTTPSTSCSGAVAANYTFAYVNGAVSIDKATPVVGAWSNVSKDYGDSVFAVTPPTATGVTGATLSGAFTYASGNPSVATISGADVTITGQGSSIVTATFTPSDTTNYTSTSTTMTLSVTAATVTVTASSPSVLFGAAIPTITETMTGFAYGQTDTVLTTQPTCTTVYTQTSNAGTSPATSCSGAEAANYTFVYVDGAVTIGKATPALGTWSDVSKDYGDPQFSLSNPTATGVTGTALAGTWAFASGTTTVATVAGNAVSITGAGSSAFTATFTPTDTTNYNSNSTTTDLTVDEAPLTVTASSASVIYGAAVPTISASYDGFVYGQNAGAFDAAPTCSTTYTDTSSVGSYPTSCSGGVSANYTFTYVAGSVTVGQATPSLAWSGVTKTYENAPFTLTAPTATGVGGASVAGTYSYASSDTSVATVSGNVVTIVGAGSTTLTATFTPTSGDYLSGRTVTATLTVNKANQADLNMTSPSTAIYGETINLASSGGSGTGAVSYGIVTGTCTIAGTTLTLGNAGSSCQVSATKQTDANYNIQTSATQTITISQAGQTLAFTSSVPTSPLPNGTYVPAASAISTVSGSSSGVTPSFAVGGACTLTGGVVTFTVAGTCTITASAGSNTNFTAATSVTQVIAVGSLNQNITFPQPANVAFGTSSVAMTATASSGLTVSYSLGGGTTSSACSVSSLGVVTILAVGTCEVVAAQVGDAQYAAASTVARAFQVNASLASAPFLTSASASDQAITIGFTAPGFTGGVSITAYRLVATPLGGGTVVSTTACTTTPCTISGLTNGTAYTVTAAAINSAGTGPASSASTAMTPVTTAFAVGALAATPGNGFVDLSWIALTNAQLGGGTFTRYEVSKRVAGTSTWTLVTNALTVQSTSAYQVTGLSNGTSYDFQVVAITSANAGEIPGNTAQVVQYPSTVPSAPVNVTVLASTATDVQVSWQTPLSDGGSVLTTPFYAVAITSTSAGATTPITCTFAAVGDRFCSASGLSNGASYLISVTASNRMGNSLAGTDSYNVPSADATLSELELTGSAGAVALTPAFAPITTTYSAAVDFTVPSVTVTPTTSAAGALVSVDGTNVVSGESSSAIALSVGTNVITVIVTATDPRFTETYDITITRAPAPFNGGSDGGVSPGIPVAPPSSVVSGDSVGAVMENGVILNDVTLTENSTNSGWQLQGPDFSIVVDTEARNGSPEQLLPSGSMQVPQNGFIAMGGTGYLPDSQVDVFAIPVTGPRTIAKIMARAMENAIYVGSTSVSASGDVRSQFAIPADIALGKYVLQINGISTTNQLRSVNLQLAVVPTITMKSGMVRESAFYKGKSAKLSATGEEKLQSMISAIPKNARDVTVNIVGVSVSLATTSENLNLARDRAEVISKFLVDQGVAGTYTVSVSTSFTVDAAERSTRTLAENAKSIPLDQPLESSAGKPLTTAAISFTAPTMVAT